MNIFKRWFSRERPAPAPVRLRGFDAARIDDLSFSFASTNASINADVNAGLARMRGRARNLAQNNDYAKKFLQQIKTNVVGPNGFALQVLARDGAMLDSLANTLIETAFRAWCARGVCELSGKLSFIQVQGLIAQAVGRDGEALVRIWRGASAGNSHQFALQLLDVDRLPIDYNVAQVGNGNRIEMGVEINAQGRPVAYHLYPYHPGETTARSTVGARFERVPAAEIMHLFRPSRPEQRRGVPEMHTAMFRLEMLSKFEAAAVVAARRGAETLGFFISVDGSAPILGEVGPDGNQISTSVPGQFDTLPTGYDFKGFDSKYPSESFGPFVKHQLRGISSGLGVSYNSLASDLEGVNYSSIRAGVLEERDVWMDWQTWMIESFLTPVYEAWLPTAMAAGAIAYGSSGLPLPIRKIDQFLVHSWQGRRWSWVDPLKDVQANIESINAGLKSRRQVIAEQGQDLDEVWSQLQAENDLAESLDLEFGSDDFSPRPAAPAAAAPADDDLEDDTESMKSRV
jgi:lambda family phage portal protein